MALPPATWKAIELFVARYLGGERTHWKAEDVRAKGFNIEVKHGNQIPKTLLKWWDQACKNSPGERVPLLILHPKGLPREHSLAVIRIDELRRLLDK